MIAILEQSRRVLLPHGITGMAQITYINAASRSVRNEKELGVHVSSACGNFA